MSIMAGIHGQKSVVLLPVSLFLCNILKNILWYFSRANEHFSPDAIYDTWL